MIPAAIGLVRNARQERPYGRQRIVLRPESGELGMMTVAPGRAGQHLLREERLAPRRDQTLRVKVSRM